MLVKALIDGHSIGQNIVVVGTGRYDLVQCFGLSQTDIMFNTVGGGDLSQRNGASGDQSEKTQAYSVTANGCQ